MEGPNAQIPFLRKHVDLNGVFGSDSGQKQKETILGCFKPYPKQHRFEGYIYPKMSKKIVLLSFFFQKQAFSDH